MQLIYATDEERIDYYDVNKKFFVNEITGEKFVRSNFNDINMVIDDETGYINATRVCSINGSSLKRFMERSINLRKLLIRVRHLQVFDIFKYIESVDESQEISTRPNEPSTSSINNSQENTEKSRDDGFDNDTSSYQENREIVNENITSTFCASNVSTDETLNELSDEPETSEVKVSEMSDDSWISNNIDLLINIYSDKSDEVKLTTKKLREIYQHLPFIDLRKTNKGYNKEARGTYIHPKLINVIALYADEEYGAKVDQAMILLNERHHLKQTKLTHEIKSLKDENEQLKIDLKNSNATIDHRLPGCVILKPVSGMEKTYHVTSDTIARHDDKWIIYNGIYNPTDTANMLKLTAKYEIWSDITYISNSGAPDHRSMLKIENIENIPKYIKDIQEFKFPKISSEKKIERCLKKRKTDTNIRRAKMFEVYCSIKYDIDMFCDGLGQKLSLTKQDRGLDLLDTEKRIMGQCKCYMSPKTYVSMESIHMFIEYCTDFPEYRHNLYVNSKANITQDVLECNDFDLILVDQDEFMEWYFDKTKFTTKITALKNMISDINENEYLKAEEWLKNELKEKPFIYREDAIDYINSNFDMFISDKHVFGKMFSHLYKGKAHGLRMPRDKDHRMMLIGLDKPTFRGDPSIEISTIIDIIGPGQWRPEEFLNELKQRLGYEITSRYLKSTGYMNMFMTIVHRGLIVPRFVCCDANKIRVFELKEEYYSTKSIEFKTFLEPLVKKMTTLTELVHMFNTRFHHYEGEKGLIKILDELEINHDYKYLSGRAKITYTGTSITE